MQCLKWLLREVQEPSIVHDILWQFSAALSDHPVHQTAAKVKAKREKAEKGGQVCNTCCEWSSSLAHNVFWFGIRTNTLHIHCPI